MISSPKTELIKHAKLSWIYLDQTGVEIVDPKHRVWYAVVTPLWYNVGYIVVPGMAFAIRDYQKLLIPAACITVLMFSYYW